jgi:type I restriction enzyme S subunit
MGKVKLGEIASERKETCKSLKIGYPVVGLEHLAPNEVTLAAWEERSDNTFTKLFRKGDVLFGRRRAYLKKASVAPFDGICSGDITVIAANPQLILPELLPFIIQNDVFFDFAVEKSAGSLSPRVKWEHLKNYEFELPNKDKQKELAEVLWAMDATKKAYQKLILATDELVKSQFIERFGTYEQTDYEIRTLEDLCEPIKDGTHQTPTYTNDKENGYPFYSSKDVTSRYMDWDHPMYIPAELHEQLYKRIAPRKGDILLAKNGTTGIAAIVDRDEVFDIYVSLALLRPHPGNDVKYLWAAINMPETKKQFDASLKGIGVPNLHLGEIKKARIVVPPLEMQHEFSTLLEQSDKSKFVGSNRNLSRCSAL